MTEKFYLKIIYIPFLNPVLEIGKCSKKYTDQLNLKWIKCFINRDSLTEVLTERRRMRVIILLIIL